MANRMRMKTIAATRMPITVHWRLSVFFLIEKKNKLFYWKKHYNKDCVICLLPLLMCKSLVTFFMTVSMRDSAVSISLPSSSSRTAWSSSSLCMVWLIFLRVPTRLEISSRFFSCSLKSSFQNRKKKKQTNHCVDFYQWLTWIQPELTWCSIWSWCCPFVKLLLLALL